MRRFFGCSCAGLALCVLAPFAARAATVSPRVFPIAFFIMALGAPFAYLCVLIGGIALTHPETAFEMPLLRAGLVIAASPLLLRGLVAALSVWIPEYSGGAQGMDQLARYLAVVLIPGGLLASATALTVFIILQRRTRTRAE